MSYLTYSDLDGRKGILKKAFESYDFAAKDSFKTTIFLSHRHKDKERVKEVIAWLNEFDTRIYIDVYDYSLPDKTNGETANKIKQKIKAANKFILLASENSLESKWIPWELGLGDAIKGLEHVAILPLLNNKDNWKEREYYQIYGTIEKTEQNVWGYFPANSTNGTRLEKWLIDNSLILKG